ncbi:MAG: signal peptide peptidase SppA [Myxococcales bacterium]|nr:signal peptide peptidase SppA [Myxococcales bacterium]MCB9642545.1 signal peptide peptidase SppA [Myxococcales bacterium]
MEPQPASNYPPSPYPGYLPPRRNSSGCLVGVGCVLLLSLVVNVVLFGQMTGKQQSQSSRRKLREVVLSGKGENKIAVLDLSGVIMEGVGSFRERATAASFLPMIRQAQRDPKIRGVLLVANSPGGSVTASDKIYHALTKLAKKKPIVAIMGDTCASGCVYATAAAHKIMAHPTTVTGSIGVIVSTLNFAGMLEKIGVKGIAITSKKNKALLSPYEPVQEEHKQIIKAIVDKMYHRFVDIVAKGRKMKREDVMKVADGRVFVAEDALKYKLIDRIGYRKEAQDLLLKMTKLPYARFVAYRREATLFDIFAGMASMPDTMRRAAQPSLADLLRAQTPRAWYIWPGAQP